MAIKIKDFIQKLPQEEQDNIQVRAKELLHEQMTLHELRKASGLTQMDISKRLGIGQDSISRMESRDDIKLSSLNKWVDAIGGKLRIVIDFDDRPSVVLKDYKK